MPDIFWMMLIASIFGFAFALGAYVQDRSSQCYYNDFVDYCIEFVAALHEEARNEGLTQTDIEFIMTKKLYELKSQAK